MSQLTKRQTKTYGPKQYQKAGDTLRIVVTVRYDDECGNGHNSFSITANIDVRRRGHWKDYMGGCCHDEVVKHFPELAPYIKWHLTSADGPMHYPGNVIYHAGDRDCWGGRANDPRWYNYYVKPAGGGLLVDWPEGRKHRIIGPKVQTFKTREEAQGVADAHGAAEVVEYVTCYHEGKARDLDAARSCAVWPEATDAQLTDPGLKERLIERLPALMAEFKAAVESLGLTY